MRMMGADVLTHGAHDAEPHAGRAVIWVQKDNGQNAHGVVNIMVRFLNQEGTAVTHCLIAEQSEPERRLLNASSIVVLLASNPHDLHTADEVGRHGGWIPLAISQPEDFASVGYAVGVGIGTAG